MNDLDLLRQYEPIIKFTAGELFFPCAVDEYIRQSSLWVRPPNQGSRPKIPQGELDLEKLAVYNIENPIKPGHSMFLRFVERPLNSLEYTQWLNRKDRPRFRAPGRLARVGLLPRLADAFFDISLLLRGKVPGGTTAAAEIKYRAMRQVDPRYVYYGRVLRENGYIILHYLFFYAMNNWRSSFYGVNDHESDWEQIFVYLVDDDSPEPAWVAYASHDFSGDDLRRRWDDPELERQGSHPVIFAGAGSHASYFQQGEYLAQVELAYLKPFFNLVETVQNFWRVTLRQGKPSEVIEQVGELLRMPFVDYARGDGFTIGPGQQGIWTPILLDNETGWVDHYRGLWGLDTKDPLRGESAPGGPKYNRDGTIRESWYDPLGWAGLRKVPPFPRVEEVLKRQITDLKIELTSVEKDIERLTKELPELEIEVHALQPYNHLRELHTKREKKLLASEQDLNQLYTRKTELIETLRACTVYLSQIRVSGAMDDNPQAHIHHKHMPQSTEEVHSSKIASFWAAISSGLLLLGTITLFVVRPPYWVGGLGGLLVMFVAIESILRRNFQQLLLRTTITLALISVAVLVYEFYAELLFLVVVALALMIIYDNIRELRGH